MVVDSPLSPGYFMDVFPVSLMTTSTLKHTHELRPETNFDMRRFRMNVVVKTTDPRFVENSWVGKTLTIGIKVPLIVIMPDPGCVLTTLPQNDIPKDNHVLRTLVDHNRLDIIGSGKFPSAGVYDVVGTAGMVRIGDHVELS